MLHRFERDQLHVAGERSVAVVEVDWGQAVRAALSCDNDYIDPTHIL